MKRKDWLFGLKEISGLGYETVTTLLKHEHELGDITALETGDLMKLGISRSRAERISRNLSEEFVAERYERYAKAGIHVIVFGDEAYPPLLKEIPYAPYVLYVKGNISLLHHPSIAVVGTRRATVYGKRATRRIVSELCALGFGIVSGMARGIGIAIGFTFFAATILYVLQMLGKLNLPIIGDYIADIVRIVQRQLEGRAY